MNFILSIVRWVLSLVGLGGIVKPSAVKLGDKIFMPLFYQLSGSPVEGTWKYLHKSDGERASVRKQILAGAKSGETPAICFLLGPNNCNGDLFASFPGDLPQDRLDAMVKKVEELAADGIAVIPCLYADDCVPWWMDIKNHGAAWTKIHGAIKHVVSGWCLSIESNDQAKSREHMEEAIAKMREFCPGAQLYTTHLQWHSQSHVSSYKWIGTSNNSTPRNVDCVFAELSWHPNGGDAAGVNGVKEEYNGIKSCESTKLILHEYNLNPNGSAILAQREWMRQQNSYGVG